MFCTEKNFLDTFNNREIAIAIWLFAVIVFFTLKKPIRKEFHRVWKAFFRGLILVPLGLMAGYIALVVFGLYKVGFWNCGLLKDTILWGLSVAVVSLFRVSQITEDVNYFRNAIKDNFKVVIILEFVVAFYTFPLWAELLIVPLATVLIMMQVVAETKEDYKPGEKLLGYILSLFGVGLFIYATYKLLADFATFAQTETLTEFSLPVLLSLLFLPFLFVLNLYANYDNAFMRLDLMIRDNALLRHYAKRAAVFGFHVRVGLLTRWIRNIQLKTPTNRSEIKTSIRRVKDLAARERNPVIVPPEQGWSPYRAGKFLVNEGLVANDYRQDPFDDTLWVADSRDIEIGNAFPAHYIAYYVEGNEHIALRLKLVASFNDPKTTGDARQRFVEIAGKLFQKVFSQEMPNEFLENIIAEIPHSQAVEDKKVQFTRKPWSSASGYSLHFIIEKTIP